MLRNSGLADVREERFVRVGDSGRFVNRGAGVRVNRVHDATAASLKRPSDDDR